MRFDLMRFVDEHVKSVMGFLLTLFNYTAMTDIMFVRVTCVFMLKYLFN